MGRTMLTALQAHPAFRVTGAYDPVQPAPAGVQAYASAEVLAASPGITLIYVASPPRHHLAGIMLAAVAGKPVLCEKPLAPSVEEARHCLAMVERSGIPAAVNFYFAASDAALPLSIRVARTQTSAKTKNVVFVHGLFARAPAGRR